MYVYLLPGRGTRRAGRARIALPISIITVCETRVRANLPPRLFLLFLPSLPVFALSVLSVLSGTKSLSFEEEKERERERERERGHEETGSGPTRCRSARFGIPSLSTTSRRRRVLAKLEREKTFSGIHLGSDEPGGSSIANSWGTRVSTAVCRFHPHCELSSSARVKFAHVKRTTVVKRRLG